MKKRIWIWAGFLLAAFITTALAYDLLKPLNTAVRSLIGAGLYGPFYDVAIFLHYFFETELGVIQTLLWGAAILFLYRSRSGAVLLITAMLAQSIAVNLLKAVVGEPRPPQEYFGVFYHNFSYPSGHTCTAVTITIMLAWIIRYRLKRREGRAIAAAYAVLALATAYSRMYLDVHWISDIIGGVTLGGFLSLIFIAMDHSYKTIYSNKP
jgi:membrane-associated phospholipid phosphatase